MAYTSVIPVRRLDWAVKYVMNKENKAVAVKIQFLSPRRARRIKHKTAEQFDNGHESDKNLFL